MEQFLTANNNEVDAVVASNDGTAGGAIAALAAQGLAGSVPVSGQDGDHAALNRIALGTQTVSVWKDCARTRQEGRRNRRRAGRRHGARPMSTASVPVRRRPEGRRDERRSSSRPLPITKDNLDVVIDAGWVTKDVVCQGVAAGTRRRLRLNAVRL